MIKIENCRFVRHLERLQHRLSFYSTVDQTECLGLVRSISINKPRYIDPRYHYTLYYIDQGADFVRDFSPQDFENVVSHPAIPLTVKDLQDNLSGMQQRITQFRSDYGDLDPLVVVLRENCETFIADLIPIMLANDIEITFYHDFLFAQHLLFGLS